MLLGTGATIAFENGFLAEILEFNGPNLQRESVDTTHMTTPGARTFLPGDLYDPGEMSISIGFNPATVPPIDQAASACTVTFSDGTSWTGSAFLTGYEPTTPLEDKMTADVTLKWTGPIQIGGSSI